jgi:methyl-accepting chemotaxis protein
MIAWIRKLVIPQYEDQERYRRSFNLNVVLLVTFAVMTLGVIAMLFQVGTRPLSYVLPNTAFIVFAALIVLLCYRLSRTGRIRTGSTIFVAMMTLACIGAIVAGGTAGALPVVLIIPIAAAGVTLGSGASLLLTVLNLVALGIVALLEMNGVIQISYPTTDMTILLNIFDVGFALFFVVISIWLSSYSLQRALERTREAVVEANHYAVIQKAQREHLEITVEKYLDHMAQITTGNLAARLPIPEEPEEQDPLIVLGQNLNDTVASLQAMILQIRNAATGLNEAAAEIMAATTQQISGAAEQSAAISQTTSTVDEVKVIADQSVARAQEVADSAQRTVHTSRGGRQAVQATIGSMGRIKDQVEAIAENILTLSGHTQQIGTIIATVNDIAAQSNMLALNAAVEAARAGEQGKGFAVVAQEVRSLADQSRQATAQVRAILEEIQAATNTTVMATEEGTKGADEGVQLAAQAGQAIEQLAAVIDESAQAASQMVAGGRQQVSGIEQIALAMQNINQATAQGLSSIRQTENAVRNLRNLAGSLGETVEQYQV